MPDRMIRSRARSSPTLAALSDGAERAWWRLTVTADDRGGFDATPEVLLAELFTRRPVGWTVRRMVAVLGEWDRVGLVHRYAVETDDAVLGTREYGHVVTWPTYQRLRDSQPRYPTPPCDGIASLSHKCGESRQSAANRGLARARASEVVSEEVEVEVSEEVGPRRAAPPDGAAPRPPVVVFRIPDSITEVLDRTPRFKAVRRLRTPHFWQPQFRAYSTLDFAGELAKAAAWCEANPRRAPKSDLPPVPAPLVREPRKGRRRCQRRVVGAVRAGRCSPPAPPRAAECRTVRPGPARRRCLVRRSDPLRLDHAGRPVPDARHGDLRFR